MGTPEAIISAILESKGGCVDSGFDLREKHDNQGLVIWDDTVKHTYYISLNGEVQNLEDQGFAMYPSRTREQLTNLVENGQAIILKNRETAGLEVLLKFDQDFSDTPPSRCFLSCTLGD